MKLKQKVVIVGGGFAGLSAARCLRREGVLLDVTVLDKQAESCFLPLIPDIIGRGISDRFLRWSLDELAKNIGFTFLKRDVIGVDLIKKIVISCDQDIPYDYLIIACGSQTNFYGNQVIRHFARKLDNIDDALAIRSDIAGPDYAAIVVAGGGYTGIEAATNVWRYFRKLKLKRSIVIVERAPSILGPLPDIAKKYVEKNLRKMGIEVLVGREIVSVDDSSVVLDDGRKFPAALLVWTAGVKTPGFVDAIKMEKDSQGRLMVDDCLRLAENCFVAGDAAGFIVDGKPLRMGVQFSLVQGDIAARNILACISGRPMRKFEPKDPGYIIPMANNKAWGLVMGVQVWGIAALKLHYLMCLYRLTGFKNRTGVAADLLADFFRLK